MTRKREPKYFYWKSKENGLWYFHLKGGNGEIQHPSEGYSSKQKCLDGIARIQKNSQTKIIIEL
jgi:uncharacterized protein YegP (UPF0339 family)